MAEWGNHFKNLIKNPIKIAKVNFQWQTDQEKYMFKNVYLFFLNNKASYYALVDDGITFHWNSGARHRWSQEIKKFQFCCIYRAKVLLTKKEFWIKLPHNYFCIILTLLNDWLINLMSIINLLFCVIMCEKSDWKFISLSEDKLKKI